MAEMRHARLEEVDTALRELTRTLRGRHAC
jgi:hypothetical protein